MYLKRMEKSHPELILFEQQYIMIKRRRGAIHLSTIQKLGGNKANEMLWQGSLIGSEINELSWAPLTLELVTARSNPMCFKLKENFDIAGGYSIANDTNLNCKSLLCCDRYNLQKGKIEKSLYSLPYSLSDMDKVSTDAEETFALILRNTSGKAVGGWLTFTEKDGFKELLSALISE